MTQFDGLTAGAAPSRAGIGSPTALRDANRRRVLDLLRRNGPTGQSEIARGTGLSRATVSNIVRDLSRIELVSVADGVRSGRRVAEVTINRRAGLAVGVDFGHRHLRIALADLGHTVLAERSVRLQVGHTAEEDIALVETLVDSVLDEIGAVREEIIGIGMGLPAPIDPTTGAVDGGTILPGWKGVPAADSLWQRLRLPVAADNDANLGALAEMAWGAGEGCQDLVYLKASNGIGAGLVLRGEIYRGGVGTAGEVGHTTIDEGGAVCRCGNRGCLETFAAGPALLALLRPTYGDEISLQDVIALAHDGDVRCQRVIADAGRYLGLAVANICNLIAPQRVIIGGDLAGAGDLLLTPLVEVVRRQALRPAAETALVVPARLAERAEVLGAVALVLYDSERFHPRAEADRNESGERPASGRASLRARG